MRGRRGKERRRGRRRGRRWSPLITDDAGLAVVAGPPVLLEVSHQLGGVHPAKARLHTLKV